MPCPSCHVPSVRTADRGKGKAFLYRLSCHCDEADIPSTLPLASANIYMKYMALCYI